MAAEAQLTLGALRTPAFVVDRAAVVRSTERMRARAQQLGVALRPHLKTHKTVEIADLQAAGDRHAGLVVSTLGEARWYFDRGFTNSVGGCAAAWRANLALDHAVQLLYGVPISADKLPEVASWIQRGVSLHVLVDTWTAVNTLITAAPSLGVRFSVFLKLDCGYGRAGVPGNAPESIQLAKAIATSPHLVFQGIYSHAGHSYDCCSTAEAERAAEAERQVTVAFAEKLRGAGVVVPNVSVGATPTCSTGLNWNGCTELHPGNYVFYDVQQVAAGSALWADCACYVLTRVISVYPDRNRLMIDAGALALSKDTAPASHPGYGRVVGHDNLVIKKISQEVGIVERRDGGPITEADYPLGTLLLIIPNHACLTAACFDEYHVVDRIDQTTAAAQVASIVVGHQWKRCNERW